MTFSAWPDEKKVALLSRLLSRDENVPLHEALNRIAAQEGFGGWSLLALKLLKLRLLCISYSLCDPNCGWRRARVIGNLGNETAAAGSPP